MATAKRARRLVRPKAVVADEASDIHEGLMDNLLGAQAVLAMLAEEPSDPNWNPIFHLSDVERDETRRVLLRVRAWIHLERAEKEAGNANGK